MIKESYNSLAEMAAAATQKRATALQQANEQKFNEVLNGQFEDFDGVSKWPLLSSTIPQIDGMRFFRVPEMGESLNIELHYNEGGKEKTTLGSIGKDGVLSMKLPKILSGIDRNDLLADVLRNIDQLNPGAWVSLSSDLIISDIGKSGDGEDGPPIDKKEFLDTRRVEFLSKQPDFLAGAVGLKNLAGYFATLHRDMIVWDNEKVGNAAFIKKLDESLPESEVALVKTKSGKKQLIKKYVEPFVKHTRTELVQHGAERVIHLQYDEWIEQMINKLNDVSPRPDRTVPLEGKREERK